MPQVWFASVFICPKLSSIFFPLWPNSKTQIVTKLKLWQNSICDKTQIVTKTHIVTKLSNSSCDKTPIMTKLKLWEKKKKSKCYNTQIMKKLANSNYDKAWNTTNLILGEKKLYKGLLVTTFWHLDNQWYFFWAVFCNSRYVFKCQHKKISLI